MSARTAGKMGAPLPRRERSGPAPSQLRPSHSPQRHSARARRGDCRSAPPGADRPRDRRAPGDGDLDRLRSAQADRPWQALHIDVKKLGRIGPHGGRPPVLGRGWAREGHRRNDAEGFRACRPAGSAFTSALPAPDQRQGRALHPHDAARVGLCAVDGSSPERARGPLSLGRALQLQTTTWRPRSPAADSAASETPADNPPASTPSRCTPPTSGRPPRPPSASAFRVRPARRAPASPPVSGLPGPGRWSFRSPGPAFSAVAFLVTKMTFPAGNTSLSSSRITNLSFSAASCGSVVKRIERSAWPFSSTV